MNALAPVCVLIGGLATALMIQAGSRASSDGAVQTDRSPWVAISAGTFLMGTTETAWGRGRYNEDQVAVTLTHNFELGRYEVTQDEWTRYGFANPSSRDPKAPLTGDALGGRNPVGTVTWYEALAFANARSERASPPRPACFELSGCTGEMGRGLICASATVKATSIYKCEGYRLPTEAEWEYAARAGTQTDFYAGNFGSPTAPLEAPDPTLERIAWYVFNSDKLSHPVGLKQPNAWGLYDMAGNAYEWVFDRYGASGYGAGPLVDPTGVSDGKYRVLRGGCAWTSLVGYRSAARFYSLPTSRVPLFGLRLARTLGPGERVDSK
jgi:formylglycine-generating enzyme required for sulfatase activity